MRIPVICAPMFLVSTPELVIEQCKAGVVGAFPSLNARPEARLAEWLDRIAAELLAWEAECPVRRAAPYAVNLIVHPTNPRLEHDLEIVAGHQVPIVITSLNPPSAVVDTVHAYGGLVFHDVSAVRHARKALDAGVDGLILVCAGAGGHTGTLSPLAFTDEVRRVFDGPIALAGCVSHGRQVLAALAMGADFAYVGTRFIASAEANADARHKEMILTSAAADIVCTSAVTGLRASYLLKSFDALGLDPQALPARQSSSFSFGKRGSEDQEIKAWRDIWSAGQGVGGIGEIRRAGELVDRLDHEYRQALREFVPLARGPRAWQR